MQKAIAYYRVSTKRQGRSGLGLEAQQQAVASFAAVNDYQLIEEFIETDSGARNGRIGLKATIAECKQQNAVLLIAKLDRLSRSVAFIATLMESDIDFKVVDNPYAERFTLHILAAVAQKEREDNSKRTIAALAAAKRRGVVLGKFGRNILSQRNKQNAERFAQKMYPLIETIHQRGIHSLKAITAELNRMKIPTFRAHGAKWHITTVYRLLIRLHLK